MNIYKYIPFIITISIAFIAFTMLMAENNRLRSELVTNKAMIDRQNLEIQKQKLEIESYVCDIESMKAYAIKEYEKAFAKTKDDKTCEGRLKHLETILKSYEE